jgi:hypothetical protein
MMSGGQYDIQNLDYMQKGRKIQQGEKVVEVFWTEYYGRPFEKFVDWRQCAAVMQREAVTVIPSSSGGGNLIVAWFSSV